MKEEIHDKYLVLLTSCNKKTFGLRLKFFVICLVSFVVMKAQDQQFTNEQPTDSLEISLLTCTPGPVAYSMYGHSALRVHNFTTNLDLVFNYGVFDYHEDNFVFKFVKGETDYILGAEYAVGFFGRYKDEGAGILEQVLNLSQQECNKLNALLMENLRPENCTYRYNWLYDNCTTRARDMIERAVQGDVCYHAIDPQMSARSILHQFNVVDRWMEFGENFILGYELDRTLSKRQQMFIPSFYAADVDSATILRPDGQAISLVRETRHPLEQTSQQRMPDFDTPMLTIIFLFVFVVVVCVIELRRKRTFKWLDVTLSVLVGLAGLLVSFLFFFSEHAGVSTNILVILFNPLAFVWIPFIIMRKIRVVSYVILAEFIIFIIAAIAVRQCFDAAIWPLVSTLLLRVIVNIFINHNKSLSLHSQKRKE